MNIGKGIYRLSYVLFSVILRLFCRLTIRGKEHIPRQGPAILVANHSSLLDPFIVTCCTNRIIHWLVASWVFRIAFFSCFAKRIPFLKVEPGRGNNKEALKDAITLLGEGRVIGVFPEGGVSKNGEIIPFLSGAAYIAIRAGAPIVPLYINGARSFFKFHKITVKIGEPFFLNQECLPSDKDALARCSASIRHRIEQLKESP